MNSRIDFVTYEVGCAIPAKPGMRDADIQTPCLVPHLDAFGYNISKWIITPRPMARPSNA
ncbi:MAG: hypothetical protein JJU08_04475 [Rhodobacteraceae bacterium]|nr:hypothetical protein [Paracoccaceae bacterium]